MKGRIQIIEVNIHDRRDGFQSGSRLYTDRVLTQAERRALEKKALRDHMRFHGGYAADYEVSIDTYFLVSADLYLGR